MNTQLQSGMVYLMIICGTVFAIEHIRAFVARRSPRRELMLWMGGAGMICGHGLIGWYDLYGQIGESREGIATFSQYVRAMGFIWIVCGCLGWDRAALVVVPWRYPIVASSLLGIIGMVTHIGWGMGSGISLVTQGLCVGVIVLQFIRYAVSHRQSMVIPFIGLYVLSTVIMLLYEYQHVAQRMTPDALGMTSGINVVLFGMIAWMLARMQRQQRMVIV